MCRTLFILIILVFCSTALRSQEVLTGLYNNPHAKPQPQQTRTSGAQHAPALPLDLPFVDDFAGTSPWPNPDLWESKGIFVNHNYALNPPTVGVATFDAQDSQGRLYPHIGQSASGADTLLSPPLYLEGQANVVLSFFYQPGGAGDMPEYRDSLKLEFFAPSEQQWVTAWAASVSEQDTLLTEQFFLTDQNITHHDSLNNKFRYVALQVNDPRFMRSGFRFRFVNLVSLSSSPVPGRDSNCDFWHIDFVYMDRSRFLDDERLPDVAICHPQQSLAIAYSSIPSEHLQTTEAQRQLFGNPMQFTLTYRNLGWGTRNITRRFSITPLSGTHALPEEYLGGSENILDGQTLTREYSFDPYPFSTTGDSASFEIMSYLISDFDTDPLRAALRHNDTIRYTQYFYNYYSYDDGTAENGYGLYGTGTASGRVAVRFEPYAADSLRAINMYFNLARDSANVKSFYITLWADGNGEPGAQLLRFKVDAPAFGDGLNRFVTYKLPEPIGFRKGEVFYVGWTQASEAYLNIGYDINTACPGVVFYNIGNKWYPSMHNGALMIRPVFGKASELPDDAEELPAPVSQLPLANDNILIYPNPAQDLVNIRSETRNGETFIPSNCRIDMYDVGNGHFVHSVTTTNGSFSVLGLPRGIYMLRIFENNQFKATRKILVTKDGW
jgi:hypothetical protein